MAATGRGLLSRGPRPHSFNAMNAGIEAVLNELEPLATDLGFVVLAGIGLFSIWYAAAGAWRLAVHMIKHRND